MRFFDREKTGHLVSRVTTDLADIGEVAHHGPEDLLVALLTFLGAFVLMLLVSWQLALVALAVVPVATWLITHFGARMDQSWRAQFRRVARFNARMEENVGGARVVQAFANEAHERALFAVENACYRREKIGAYRLMATSLTLELPEHAAGADRRHAGRHGADRARRTVDRRFRRVPAAGQRVLPAARQDRQHDRDLSARARRLPALPRAAGDAAGRAGRGEARPRRRGSAATSASSASVFGYEPDRPVLNGLDLQVRAGETVAIVGPSGAGKTTLCALLPRFYDVDAGRITIDGIDIRDVTRTSLRRQIGIVEQDVFLFAGSIRDNVAYGSSAPRTTRSWRAVRRARLEELVGLACRRGWTRDVGERGARLSGRTAAADRDRAHLPEEPADPDPGRGDLGAGQRDRAEDPALARWSWPWGGRRW